MRKLFEPLTIGSLALPNRIIMAPLTRMRSKQPGNVPHELNAKYYAQRASAGLIISEASQVSQQGQGYPGTPGIYSQEQVEGWKLVTDAVHKAGGRIFLQLWHVGRISHASHQPNGSLPVAPSALAPKDSGTYTADWQETAIGVPRALETGEIGGIVADFKTGAEMQERQALMASKSMELMAIYSISSFKMVPTYALTTMVDQLKIVPACCWRSLMPSLKFGETIVLASVSLPITPLMA